MLAVAVAIGSALVRALMGCCPDCLSHLGLQRLVENLLQQRFETVVLEEPLQKKVVKGNLIVVRPFLLIRSCLVATILPAGMGRLLIRPDIYTIIDTVGEFKTADT